MKINGTTFFAMIISAANALDNSKDVINSMNVFPVPDGDTGINMTLTMRTIKNAEGTDSLSSCAKSAADIALRSARGNSGAILSLFFRGMSKAFKGLDEADSADMARAFRTGYNEAYKAVMNPTRGTILTVMQRCADAGEELTANGGYSGNVEGFLSALVVAAEDALKKTPDQLPKLKEAGVVDAGGYGFVTILNGMLAVLQQKPIFLINQTEEVSTEANFSDFDPSEITFSYCTECIVKKSPEYQGEGTATEFNEFLFTVGDSVVFIDDEQIIKVHVHTDHPGNVLEKALCYGSLATVKIENMREQHSALVTAPAKKPMAVRPSKKYGFVSVCLGDGIADAFRDVGVDTVVHGGQTMNPSTQNIIDAVNATPAEHVYVLPNNKNIYMVAEQAAKLIKDKKVHIIPTKSVPEGISAMIAYNPDADSDTIFKEMCAAINNVKSMSITGAVRNATVEGEKISDGQMLGLLNGSIDCVADSTMDCLRSLASNAADASYIMVFCGEGTDDAMMAEAEAIFREAAPMAEVAVMFGGQPLYPFVISVE